MRTNNSDGIGEKHDNARRNAANITKLGWQMIQLAQLFPASLSHGPPAFPIPLPTKFEVSPPITKMLYELDVFIELQTSRFMQMWNLETTHKM